MKDVPSDYYRRLHAVENRHWWHVGMRRISGALLDDLRGKSGLALLDCGCGTGGFLDWASRTGVFDRLAGVDISPEALEIARRNASEAELSLAAIRELPFESESFDVVVLNDVLQHVDERDVEAGLAEVRRVLRPDGRLLLRTNGGRHARRERKDWRLYTSRSLSTALEDAGFEIERLTHVNALLSAWGALRGRSPKAPTTTSCGIPAGASGFANAVGREVLRAEASYLRQPGRQLPYGHTLFAVARPNRAVPSGLRTLEAEIETFFDRSSPTYDGGYARDDAAGRVLRRRAELAAELLGEGGGDVVDVGMGTGFLCALLHELGWTVSGVDLSPAMVEAARLRLPVLAERLTRASIHELPFPDGRFDAVVATGVLEYAVDDLDGAVRELARVLRPGGTAVLSFPNHQAPATVWRGRVLYPLVRALKGVVDVGKPAPPRVPLIRLGAFEHAIGEAGLTIERVEPVGITPAPSGVARRFEEGRSPLAFALAVQRIYRVGKPA